ncbi:asparagine synthase (glutamine-hydrolyzing) [Ornithinibacillus salinisoli]|uniref:asparagine synthase (glutamine-hydrolyzing) n=1 Tax=Ornithinibacillus salinisoli TaxID=1848459 RepID=A0ABW4VZC8_9BACI
MCGFLGALLNEGCTFSRERLQDFQYASNLLKHRGPDEEGFFQDPHIVTAFHRLCIIDEQGGSQPFFFGENRYILLFNGEIYNYVSLRNSLKDKGYQFITNSDTEVVSTLFLEKGVQSFNELRGMYSIVIWDTEEKILYGARDPFGIKPLYYREKEDEFIFASENKSILAFHDHPTVNEESLQHYTSFQYVPEPLTITNESAKLEPGHYFMKRLNQPMKKYRYFHASFHPINGNENQMINRIQEVLFDSVKMHLQSDFPVGAFLSGGIDSTLIVAIAKRFDPTIKTISVGFEMEGFSEIPIAKQTAEELGVDNMHYLITPQEYVEVLPKILWHMDDPLADPSCVPLYFAAREARKYMKVVLSGEGADELFGGYNIYREFESLKFFHYIPKSLHAFINRLAKVLPEGIVGKSFLERGTTPLEHRYIGNAKMFEEFEKEQFLKHYQSNRTYQSWTSGLYRNCSEDHPAQKMQYIDLNTWLPGDILLKADKMTMANSLELRTPFLDKEVFQVARNIPVTCKYTNGTTKAILRKAAKGIVPDHVVDRRKLGFPVPIKSWLRNELYEWAVNLMKESETDYLIDKSYVQDLLHQHVQNRADHSRKIWTVLMFMLWHQLFVEHKDSPYFSA